ncbi:MAG: ndk [Chloroflexi bacterium]|nr:ndk [Chloroflexota bacterium]
MLGVGYVASLAELHQQIRAAIEHGDIAQARSICNRVLAACPETVETYLLAAEIDLELGNLKRAVSGFERVLDADPEGYLACAGLGIAQEALHDPARALHWFSRALDLDPSNGEIRREHDRLFMDSYPGRTIPAGLSPFATGRAYLTAGLTAEAVTVLRQAVKDEPGRAEARLALAEALWFSADVAAADRAAIDVLSIAQRAVKAQAIRAAAAARTGDWPRAQTLIAGIRQSDPNGRISARILDQTGLAEEVAEFADVPATGVERPSVNPSHGAAPDWAAWMRGYLWQVLRLVGMPIDEPSDQWSVLLPQADDGLPMRLGSGPIGRRVSGATTPDVPEQIEPTTAESAMVSEEIVRVHAVERIIVPKASTRKRPPITNRQSSSPGVTPPVSPGDDETELTEVIDDRKPRISPRGLRKGVPMTERTLVIVKPDGVQRGLTGAILSRLEARGLKLIGLKFMSVPTALAERHYAIHRGKPFYPGLINYIISSPVVVAAFEGENAVAAVRSTVGATNPAAAAPGSIRGDWALEIGRNLVHASDEPPTGLTEVALWFNPAEIISWERDGERWLSEG